MQNVALRLVISTLIFLVFWYSSTIFYGKFIHDVGATHWSLGVFGLPGVIAAVWSIDFYFRKQPWFQDHFGILTTVDCVLSIAFYFPSLVLVSRVI